MKYVHSEEKIYHCLLCDSQFKQKTSPIFNIHGVNTSKAMFCNLEEIKTYEFSVCDATFKYKKDLTVHSLNAQRRRSIQTMYLSFLVQFVVKSLNKRIT